MRRTGYACVALLLVLAVFVPRCDRDRGKQPSRSAPDVIRLAALLPMTGDNAPSGHAIASAIDLAVKEANDAGGVLGRRVEIVFGDDACDPQTAVNQANLIVQKDITVSVGGYCSSSTVPTLKIFHDAGIPMIIPGANSTDLVMSGYDSVFLLAGTTALEAGRVVRWMPGLGAHRAVVVHDGTSFAQTIADATVEAARRPGSGVTVVSMLQLSQGVPRYDRVANQALAAGGDIVFYTGYYVEAARFIRDLRGAGYRGLVMLSDGATAPALFSVVGPAQVEGAFGAALPMPQFEPGVSGWAARYRAIAGHDPGPFTMQAYDGVRLALNAIQRAGTLDRAAVRTALANTTPTDVKLLSGTASFNPDGTQKNVQFILLRAHDGAFVLTASGA